VRAHRESAGALALVKQVDMRGGITMHGGRVIEWSHSSASPVTVGDTTVTPLARAVTVRWPGGGAVWSAPAAVIVEREGSRDRISIANVNRRILWGLRLSAVALVATSMAHDRRRQDSNG